MERNTRGSAVIVALAVILGAAAVGFAFQYLTKQIDHPVEQAAEEVLQDYGIDVDFSEDKKKAQ